MKCRYESLNTIFAIAAFGGNIIMEVTLLKNKLKQYLSELLIPVENEILDIKKFHTAATIRLSAIVPTIYLLTLYVLITYKKTSYNQTASSIILWIWAVIFIIYLASNSFIILLKNQKKARKLTYLCVFLEILSNELILYSVGSLTSHAVIFFIICVCIYRIFFDYYLSLFCSVSSSLIYTITAVLEFNRVIPLSPYLSYPVQHQAYSNAVLATSFAAAVVIGVFITFFAVNFSMNQILKLNRYIMENWRSDLNCLHEFSQNITSAANVDDIINLTFKTIIQLKAFDMAAFMISDEKGMLNMQSSFGWKHDWIERYNFNPINKENPLMKDLFEKKSLIIIDDISKYPDLWKTLYGINAKSIYIFPLILDNDVYGVLLIINTETRVISEHQMEMLSGITSQANISLQNLINMTKEIKKSSTDGLTGLYNRRYFDEQINKAVNEASINNFEVSLIMMDIDNFKKYNDTFGHPAGDMLLKKVAETVVKCVRSNDIAVRYGGEEFAVILRNTSISTALLIAERIRGAVENIQDCELNSKVTISAGIGSLSKNCEDAKSLIEYADKSLYHAKYNGKNRICCGEVEDIGSI